MDNFRSDLSFALRSFRRHPGFTAIAIVVLGLGIGSTAAIFSVVDATVLRPLPFQDPHRIVLVGKKQRSGKLAEASASRTELREWRTEARSVEKLTAYHQQSVTMGSGADATYVSSLVFDGDLFGVLGVRPVLGRSIQSDDTRSRKDVVILSGRLWRQRFGADPGVIGRTLLVDGKSHTVIGVAGELRFPPDADIGVYLPSPHGPLDEQADDRSTRYLKVVGRLAPNTSLSQSQSELSALGGRLSRDVVYDADRVLSANELQSELMADLRPTMLALLFAVAFVMLIVCANVANLMLVRASAREREMAVRAAIGATRARLVRQLLTESAVLGLAGGALGLLLAGVTLESLVSLVPAKMPRPHEIHLNGRVFALIAVISLAASVLFGLAPALAAARAQVQDALRRTGRTNSATSSRGRNLLLVAEISTAFVLLAGAVLAVQSFTRVSRVDSGLLTDQLTTASIPLPPTRFTSVDDVRRFYSQMMSRLRTLPGAEGVALAFGAPVVGPNLSHSFTIGGRPPPPPSEPLMASARYVSPDFHRVVGVRLLRGRAFTNADDVETAAPVAIISDSLARRDWAREDPIGKWVRIEGVDHRIVGVVSDVRNRLDRPARPEIHRPFGRVTFLQPPSTVTALLRSDRPDSLSQPLAAALQEFMVGNMAEIRTMKQRLEATLESRRLTATLFGLFSVLALTLAVLGIYGVVSFGVAQRTRELGIRLALGATPRGVVWSVVRRSLRLTFLGLLIGAAGAIALGGLIQDQLYDTSAADPGVLLLVAAVLVLTAAVAALIPAQRAARVDPATALRSD